MTPRKQKKKQILQRLSLSSRYIINALNRINSFIDVFSSVSHSQSCAKKSIKFFLQLYEPVPARAEKDEGMLAMGRKTKKKSHHARRGWEKERNDDDQEEAKAHEMKTRISSRANVHIVQQVPPDYTAHFLSHRLHLMT